MAEPTTGEIDHQLVLPAGWVWKLADGAYGVADGKRPLPPGARLVIDLWVACAFLCRDDGWLELRPLTTLLGSAALAEQLCDQMNEGLGARCFVLSVAVTYDLRDTADRDEFRRLTKAMRDDSQLAGLQ